MNALATTVRMPLTLRADDGTPLEATLFRADAPRAAVLIAGALATRHLYYRRFATWLADRGYSTLTFDYRGIGGSRAGSLRGYPATLQDWGRRDVDAALAALREHTPDVPVFVIGHSFGGQSLALSEGLTQVDGLLTVAAQLGYEGHWEGAARARMWTLWNVLFPTLLTTYGYIPGWMGIGEDLPPAVAAEWSKWCRSPGYFLDHLPDAEPRMRRFRGRAEVWALTDDAYAPMAAVRAYAALVGPNGAWVRPVSPERTGRPIGHFGPFRSEFAATLWIDVDDVLTSWL